MLKERPQIQDQFFEVLRQKIFSGTSEAKIRALSVFAEIIRNDDDIIFVVGSGDDFCSGKMMN